MTWSKLAGIFSLKAILLACFLTPVTVATTGITAAQAQFQIVIPGFGFHRGYRRYGRSSYRHSRYSRRGSRRGGGQQEAGSAEQQIGPTKNPTGGGVRPTSE
jgi:hypothetical protein